MISNKMIQIIPAPNGLYAVTHDDCGYRKEVPLVCFGLKDYGAIRGYHVEDGQLHESDEIIDRRR